MKHKTFFVIALTVVAYVVAGAGTGAVFAENIDPYEDGSQYAYGQNVGWLNFEPNKGPGVTVSDSNLAGYIWVPNIGWLNLWPAVYGGVFNDGNGLLSGYAWGQNVGWINFAPIVPGDSNDYGVYIDACGDFNGLAWGGNIGWISFGSDGAVFYRLTSDWVSPIDTIAPETLPDIEILEWFNTDVNLTLLATDCGSGPNEVHYTLNGGPEVVTAGSSASLNIIGDGIHILTFFSIDVDGNIETVSEVIIQIDTTPPVITLNGPAAMTLECGIDSYAELGATAADNLDPAVAVVIGGDTVETSVCGVYNVTYDATDVAGNAATQVVREVTVEDTIAPAITLTSPAEGATYYIDEVILADFAVSDGGSGIDTITATVPSGNSIDTATEGIKTFTVSATDNASNSNTVSHSYTVIPRGNIDPCDDGSQYAYGENVGWLNFEPGKGPGVTVSDSNLTGYIWAENIGWINLSPASYGGVLNDGTGQLSGYAWGQNVGWINFDPTVPGDPTDYGVSIDDDGIFNGWAWGGNIGWIHLRSETPIVYKVQTAWFIPNKPPVVMCQDVTVSAGPDCTADASVDDGSYDPDGDPITVTQDPPGPYGLGDTDVTLTVTDDKGASDMCSATVTVVDTTPPVITCPADVTVEQESYAGTVVALEATATDNCDPNPVITSDELAVYPLGVTIVTFTATDASGNSASCSMTVTVVDTTPPEITLNGDATITLECGIDSYTEEGATAMDICDPDVPVIVGGDMVDTSACGTYEVTYDATDDSGNSAAQVTRTVIVEDTIPPEFSLSVKPKVLWPANHKMVKITPSWEVSDNCDELPDVTLVSITMNEDDDAKGDGHTSDDIQVNDNGIWLRAERSGKRAGRIYTIIYRAVDDSGNITLGGTTVTVPHDRR